MLMQQEPQAGCKAEPHGSIAVKLIDEGCDYRQ